MNICEPIFIGGMYKSGTSLLRAMLGRHSRLFAGLETQWPHQRWHEGDTARRNWLQRLSVFFETPLDKLEAICSGAENEEGCLDRMMMLFAARAGKVRWIEKTPANVGVIPRILAHWPEARILHVIRDPRDVYASMVETGKWTEPAIFADRWCATIGQAKGWLASEGGSHPCYYELRYERLVLEPAPTMRDVVDFLGESFEPAIAEFDGTAEDFERVRRATGKESASLRRLARPLTSSRVLVWRSVFGPERWGPIRAELDRRGYGNLADALIAEGERYLGSISPTAGAGCS